MRSSRTLFAAAFLAGILSHLPAYAVNPQADVVVYGSHEPERFRSPSTPFQNPYSAAEDTVDDPPTRMILETIDGMRNVLGTEQWGITTFGKYVFIGNYKGTGVVVESAIGVFDSEKKEFFEIVIPNDAGKGASKRTLQTANPSARKSRILLAGDGLYQASSAGFAYIEADLDTPPSTWPVTVTTQAQLGMVGLSDFDGLSLLRHEDDATPLGRDYVLLNAWYGTRIHLVRVDSSGTTLLASYATPNMVLPTGPGGSSCSYILRPVQLPTVDPSRPRNDQRFVTAYDASPPTGCPYSIKIAQEFRIDLDSATPTITPTSPLIQATTLASPPPPHQGGSNAMLSSSLDSEGNLWVSHTYGPGAQGDTKPALFYKKTTSSPTGCTVNGQPRPSIAGEHCYYMPGEPADQVYAIAVDQTLDFDYTGVGVFGSAHGIVQVGNRMYLMSQNSVQRATLAYGSWSLEDDTSYKMSLHSPILPAEPRECRDYKVYKIFNLVNVHHACDCAPGTDPDATCSAEPECVDGTGMQRDCSPVLWACRETADTAVGSNNACVCPSDNDTSCAHASCLSGESCRKFTENAVISQWNWIIAAGGSPPSLWVAERYRGALGVAQPKQNLYMFRIPYRAALSDNTSLTRPGVAWIDNRLWLVSEHGGGLAYRIREEGQWSSSWSPMPTNVATSGGAALISTPTYVPFLEAFARGASGGIYNSTLTVNGCTQGACAWANWQLLSIPGSITPVGDPAAAYLNVTAPIVVVRNSADNGIYFTRRWFSAWSTWTQIPGLTSDASPSVTWNPNDGSGAWWVAARESGTGKIRTARVIPNGAASTWSGWTDAGSSAGLAPWLLAPTITHDGDVIRVFTADTVFPSFIYQAVHDGTSWGSWKGLSSEGITTRQAGVAVVNGDVNLIQSWWNGLAEQLAK